MKKSLIIIGVILVLVFIIYRLFIGSFNGMVDKEENVKSKWAQVENSYQSRMDKTKVLVETVKGAANFEKSTLTEVIQARASATSAKIDANNLSPENVAAFQKAQEGFSSSLSRLLVVAEQYPELKATESFKEFQSQYEGMENRISVARMNFNEVVQDYNKYIRSFPNNIFAGLYGFAQKGYFQAVAGAEKAPEVKF
jgi:LemA protein